MGRDACIYEIKSVMKFMQTMYLYRMFAEYLPHPTECQFETLRSKWKRSRPYRNILCNKNGLERGILRYSRIGGGVGVGGGGGMKGWTPIRGCARCRCPKLVDNSRWMIVCTYVRSRDEKKTYWAEGKGCMRRICSIMALHSLLPIEKHPRNW